MKEILIKGVEAFDESTNQFITTKDTLIHIEHSLISISTWEAKWHKPFLSQLPSHKKTDEEMLDYLRCMCLDKNVDPMIFGMISAQNLEDIKNYIDDSMTATTFDNIKNNMPPSREIITSEIIYYWMVANQIPFECQKWHINRLLTLIQVCSIKNQPPKKMGKGAWARKQHALNQSRLKGH